MPMLASATSAPFSRVIELIGVRSAQRNIEIFWHRLCPSKVVEPWQRIPIIDETDDSIQIRMQCGVLTDSRLLYIGRLLCREGRVFPQLSAYPSVVTWLP